MKELHDIINEFRLSGNPFSIRELVKKLEEKNVGFLRDEIVEALQHYFPLYFHFTPAPISFLMSEIARSYHAKNVADICCGIGSNLVACDFAKELHGFELNQEIVEFAKYLNPQLDFQVIDSTQLKTDKKYDAVISTLPFGGRFNDGKRKTRLEVVLLEKAISITKEGGVIIVVIPNNLLTDDDSSKLRDDLINKYSVDGIIEIPLKHSWMSVDASVIIIRKGPHNRTVYFGKYKGDPVSNLTEFREGLGDFWINYSRLINRLDRHYFHPKHDELKQYLSDSNTKTIDELASVIAPPIITSEMLTSKGKYIVLRPKDFDDNGIHISVDSKYLSGDLTERESRAVLQPGDIIVGLRFNNKNLYTYTEKDPPAILGNGSVILRSRSGEYIKTYLSTEQGKEIVRKQADMKAVGSIMPTLPISRLRMVQIPIIPISELNLLSDRSIETAIEPELNELKNELEIISNQYEAKGSLIEFLEDRFRKIENQLNKISSKVDDVLAALNELQSSLKEIKELPREEEDKLRRIYRAIDEKLGNLSEKERDIAFYQEEVKQWFDYWEQLDEASKQFLPSAEYLFDSIHKVGAEDYSPFIIQYCRALENELLKKLFESYHEDLFKDHTQEDIKEMIAEDLRNSDSKANIFAKFVQRDNRKYTLGQMKWIIALTKDDSSTLKLSKLVSNFRTFILKYYNEQLLEKKYINLIEKISEDYRNKSAHPYIMTLDSAMECQILIRESLIMLYANRKHVN